MGNFHGAVMGLLIEIAVENIERGNLSDMENSFQE